MSTESDESSAPARDWRVRPEMPKPLTAALAVLKEAGCALAQLDLVDPVLHERLDGPLREEIMSTLEVLNDHHQTFRGRQLPGNVRDAVLQGAHILDWPATLRLIVQEGRWVGEAARTFHSLRNVVVLCTTCHPLFDNARLIPVELVRLAREEVMRTEIGRRALELFINRTLAMRAGPDLFNVDVAWAAHELKTLHGEAGQLSVTPWPKNMRGWRSTVDTAAGLISLHEAGDDPSRGHMFFGITTEPPPEPTHPSSS